MSVPPGLGEVSNCLNVREVPVDTLESIWRLHVFFAKCDPDDEDHCGLCKSVKMPLALFREAVEKRFPHPVPKMNDLSRYREFGSVCGTHTTDAHQPLKTSKPEPFTRPTNAQETRDYVFCEGCAKPRLIFCEFQLTEEQRDALQYAKERANFSCGDVLVEQGDESYQQLLYGKFYANQKKRCDDPVEPVFYFSNMAGEN